MPLIYPVGFLASSSSPATVTSTDTGNIFGSNTNSQTFTSKSFGSAFAGRYILVAISLNTGGSGGTDASVTVAGNAATQIIKRLQGNSFAALYIVALASGTSGNIVVTGTGNFTVWGAAVYSLANLTGAGAATSTISTDSSATLSATLPSVSAGGVAIGVANYANFPNGGGTATWTGITEDFDSNSADTNTCSTSASLAFAAAQTNLAVQVASSVAFAQGAALAVASFR